jgi:hypothetical protein
VKEFERLRSENAVTMQTRTGERDLLEGQAVPRSTIPAIGLVEQATCELQPTCRVE